MLHNIIKTKTTATTKLCGEIENIVKWNREEKSLAQHGMLSIRSCQFQIYAKRYKIKHNRWHNPLRMYVGLAQRPFFNQQVQKMVYSIKRNTFVRNRKKIGIQLNSTGVYWTATQFFPHSHTPTRIHIQTNKTEKT